MQVLLFNIALESISNDFDSLLHALPGGGHRICYRTLDNRSQAAVRVVAAEASQDMLRHHLAQLAALGFEAGPKGLIQALESLGSGVQHGESVGDRSRRRLCHWDGAHPERH